MTRRTVLDWALVAALSGLLLVSSLAREQDLGSDFRQLLKAKDKILHGIVYGVFAVLVCRALAGRGRARMANVIGGVLLAIAYGFLLEMLQWGLSDRSASASDIGANALGAGLGGLLWFAAVKDNTSRTQGCDFNP